MELVISLNRLANRTKLPREWLRTEALAGRLPYLKVGRKLLFNPEAVERKLAERAAAGQEVAHAS